jgi:hypothetical protein
LAVARFTDRVTIKYSLSKATKFLFVISHLCVQAGATDNHRNLVPTSVLVNKPVFNLLTLA